MCQGSAFLLLLSKSAFLPPAFEVVMLKHLVMNGSMISVQGILLLLCEWY